MAWSTPATWVAGAVLTAAQLNAQLRDNLNAAHSLGVDAWTGFTPTLIQSGAVAKTVTYGKYQRIGRLVVAVARLDVTAAGTAGNAIRVGLPVAASSTDAITGTAQFYDASTTTRYVLTALGNSTTELLFIHDTSAGSVFGATPAITLASGDNINYAVTYEAAS